MPHRNLHIIVIVLLSFSAVFGQTQIAVVDFEALGVSNNDARALTNRLMIEMHRTNKFKVLEREMLDKIIEEQKFQLSGCNSDQCLVELGQIANVQQIVGGSISKVGDLYSITARLISVETGEVITSGLYDYDGKISALMKTGMASIAAQLASIPAPNNQENRIINKIQLQNIATSEPLASEKEPRSLEQKKPSVSSPPNSVTDINGNVYKTIRIGNQVWMAENLKVTNFRNGDEISAGHSNQQWKNLTTGACSIYDNEKNNVNKYGRLYNWYAVNDNRKIAPEGWHIPTDDEWKELEMTLGMSQSEAHKKGYRGTNEGGKLAGNYDLWRSGKLSSNSDFGNSGISAVPGGFRDYDDGPFGMLSYYGYFWSATENESSTAWGRVLAYNYLDVKRDGFNKRCGFSVRCVRD